MTEYSTGSQYTTGNEYTNDTDKNSKLLKGVVLGGIIGGVISLMDSNTRNSVKDTALGLKSSSQKMLTEVKDNPSEVKDQMIQQFREASNILKEAIGDAQSLYEKVNNDLFTKVGDVKEFTNTAMSTVKDAKGDIVQIGSKVAEAGTELKAAASTPLNNTNSTLSTTDTSSYDTSGNTSSYGNTNSPSASTYNTTGRSSTVNASTDSSSNNLNSGSSTGGNSYGTTGTSNTTSPTATNSSSKSYTASSNSKTSNSSQKGNYSYGGQETPDHDSKK